MKIYKKFLNLNFFADENEKEFIASNKSEYEISAKNKKYIAIQIAQDYFFLLNMKSIVKNFLKKGYTPIGIIPYNFQVLKKNVSLLEFFNEFKNFVVFKIRIKKWKKLYQSIGVNKFYTTPNIFYYKSENNKSTQKKINVLKIKIKNLNIGDLIYDTYLRFRVQKTIDISDAYFEKLLFISKTIIESLSNISLEKKISYYFTTFSSYIHHGIPCRFFLKKKINVFSYGRKHSYAKKLSIKDPLHSDNFLNLKNDFEKLKNKNAKIKEAKKEIIKKFYGKNEISGNYLNENNAYKKKAKFMNKSGIKGVLFLHDFFDAPHDRGLKHIFADHYLWADFTINCINKHNLKIAVKSHPNQIDENIKIIKILKNKYPAVEWIDNDINNLDLIKKINFGVSINGSILYELAFFNKIGISASINPTSSFKIFKDPKNIKEYKSFLINPEKAKIMKFSQIEACKVYYSIFLNNNYEDFGMNIGKHNLNYMNKDSSLDLMIFNKKIHNL
jgi:hypothetical protein